MTRESHCDHCCCPPEGVESLRTSDPDRYAACCLMACCEEMIDCCTQELAFGQADEMRGRAADMMQAAQECRDACREYMRQTPPDEGGMEMDE